MGIQFYFIIFQVFYDECVIMYLRTFNFLWRAKRMEYILATVWKDLISNAKSYRQLPGKSLGKEY